MNKLSLPKLISVVHPLFILGGVMLFALGSGIAHYLGHPVDWAAYLAGQACILSLQLSIVFLGAYFDALQFDDLLADKRERKLGSGIIETAEGKYRLSSQGAFILAATTLTFGVFFTIVLLRNGFLNPASITLMAIAFLITLFYASPPIRLADSGYGELSIAIFLANVIPGLAFILQTGGLHRLIVMTTFPLTPIYLAMTLAISLSDYYEDIKKGRHTLLVRIGWQRGMTLHNILVLVGFLLIIISLTTGLPWRIAWPALLALPMGLFQIWQMNQIAEGVKPRWRLLSMTAIATFGLTAYLFAFSYWIA